ncbi:MAG: hypothetical protein JSU03_08625 [Bacteroidetes bacterium]|nr:hypothetical protein [Bacteroidota bacterium]MBS1757328.1 hypothetical protein [Bacteroidota bacterium]
MKMKAPFIIGLLMISFAGYSQYYYKDILSNLQLRADMAKFKENKIRDINIKSYEADGSQSEGFFCHKKLSKDYKSVDLITRADVSGTSETISSFDEEGKLLSTNDSSNSAVTHNNYLYDAQGHIVSIKSIVRSSDDDFTNEISEQHLYFYNAAGQPEKMLRVKNNADTTIILFAADEQGNIAIEKDTKSGNKFYYYYDAKKHLTDIVSASDMSKNLVPVYSFEYNAAGLATQMTTSEEGTNYYFVWKYTYDNGMRIKEKCYGKEKNLLGSMEYEYK